MTNPTTEELLRTIDVDLKEARIHSLSSPTSSGIRQRWESRLDHLTAIRSIVAEHDGLTAKVGRLREGIGEAMAGPSSINGSTWRVLDAALTETEGEK